MATHHHHHHHNNNNRGTLSPGQQIAVNKYNVTVDRFLSQGGFAHVYLVTTPAPVYNTTHHVLKRIAVQSEGLLKEVKKEVDIMRLLRGHPNIVYLIDAAWHRMADGSFEVFILMELCPGGGIIDMMNRRLRERLTEAEILTIFADVCEGVACMHNLKPPLLHRDLKVENILQASATSYKLCDFGSAAPVAPRPPATTQEIRALEADLNRHTTLQYRAPEMVDPFLRRPVDEKSDVWALGVLLYKLCYYTTPFEEHGPLAILNVQYRIPPYPVYSQQMNALIASMLREHGTSRPSVFELLNVVHGLRGTTSPFKYTIPPPPQPLISHPPALVPRTSPIPPSRSPVPAIAKSSSASPTKSNAVEARDKVLEAIAPMRRGRPVNPSPSVPPADAPPHAKAKPQLVDFGAEEDKAWKNAAGHLDKEGKTPPGKENPWALASTSNISIDKPSPSAGFGDDFAEKLWETYDRPTPPQQPAQAKATPLLPSRPSQGRLVPKVKRSRDAFDGLGLETNVKAAPTLGEARKLRTGLAALGSGVHSSKLDPPAWNGAQNLQSQSKPTPSPKVSYLHPKAASHGPPSPTPWKGISSRPSSATMDNAESRFPTLEELDADFTTSGRKLGGTHSNTESPRVPPPVQPLMTQNVKSTRQPIPNQSSVLGSGSRSQQVTGSAMQTTPKEPLRKEERVKDGGDHTVVTHHKLDNSMLKSRPTLPRKHTHPPATRHASMEPPSAELGTSKESSAPKLPPRPTPTATDWLTGDDDSLQLPSTARETPVVRDSPSKRASFIEGSLLAIHEPLAALQDHAAVPITEPTPAVTATPKKSTPGSAKTRVTMTPAEPASTTNASSKPPTEVAAPQKMQERKSSSSSSSADEGPEDATGSFSKARLQSKPKGANTKHKARQSSVHDLVDLWGGGTTSPAKDKFDELSTRNASEKPSGTPKRKPVPKQAVIKPLIPRSHSPQPIRSTDTSSRPLDSPASNLQVDTSNHNKQPSKPSPSPISARSRPQSMLIFPTRSATTSTTATVLEPQTPKGLVPSSDPPQFRTARRMSITDMVQRYEAIGGIKMGNGVPPLASSKSASQTNTPTAGAYPDFKRELLVNSAGTNKPAPLSSSSNVNATREPGMRHGHDAFTGTGHVMGDYLDKPAMRPNSWQPRPRSPLKDTNATIEKTADKEPAQPPTPTPAPASPAPTKMIYNAFADVASPPAPLSSSSSNHSHPPGSVFPLRKTGLHLDEPTTSQATHEIRSPSPERPYQGVGKLIDQWQRKAATSNETPASIPPRRGPIIPKRTGLVGGASSGS